MRVSCRKQGMVAMRARDARPVPKTENVRTVRNSSDQGWRRWLPAGIADCRRSGQLQYAVPASAMERLPKPREPLSVVGCRLSWTAHGHRAARAGHAARLGGRLRLGGDAVALPAASATHRRPCTAQRRASRAEAMSAIHCVRLPITKRYRFPSSSRTASDVGAIGSRPNRRVQHD